MESEPNSADSPPAPSEGASEPPSDSAPPSFRLSEAQRLERFDEMRLAPIFFFVLVGLAILGMLTILRYFIPDLVIAAVLVVLFRRTWERITRLLGNRRWLASGIVTSLIALLIAVPLALLASTIAAETLSLYESVRRATEGGGSSAVTLSAWVQRIETTAQSLGIRLSNQAVRESLTSAAQNLTGALLSQLTAALTGTLTILFHALVVLICVFYLLVDGGRLRRYLISLSPLPEAEDELLFQKFEDVSRGILIGNGVGSLVQGILGGLAMWLVGLPSAVLWATVMSVLAFLPIIGISIVVIPATAYLLLQGKYAIALAFFLFCTAQGLFMENVGKTWLIGRRTRMHDLLVFLSVLGGIAAFGIMGLLYGPLLVAAFLTLGELYNQVYHQKLAAFFRARRR